MVHPDMETDPRDLHFVAERVPHPMIQCKMGPGRIHPTEYSVVQIDFLYVPRRYSYNNCTLILYTMQDFIARN